MGKKLIISTKKYKGETVVISGRVPADLVARLDMICEKTGRTKNELIVMSLEFALDNMIIEDEEGDGDNA